jgi:uncharacterized protein YbjT (DUF2867 family)
MSRTKLIAVAGATGSQGGGLARAILADADSEFAVRALTRNVDSASARELASLGAEVVAANVDEPDSVAQAFEWRILCVLCNVFLGSFLTRA